MIKKIPASWSEIAKFSAISSPPSGLFNQNNTKSTSEKEREESKHSEEQAIEDWSALYKYMQVHELKRHSQAALPYCTGNNRLPDLAPCLLAALPQTFLIQVTWLWVSPDFSTPRPVVPQCRYAAKATSYFDRHTSSREKRMPIIGLYCMRMRKSGRC